MNHTWDLSEADLNRIKIEVIKNLNGVPVSQALHLLEDVKSTILKSHIIDINDFRLSEEVSRLQASVDITPEPQLQGS